MGKSCTKIDCNSQQNNVCCAQAQDNPIDYGEFNIHKELNIPRGRLFEKTLQYLSDEEKQLMYACSSKNISAVRYFIKQGASPNTYDENRTSPLHVACREGSYQIVEELINQGSSLEITDSAGWTPLHIASYQGRPEIVRLLLSKNADATACNRRAQTPWDLAADEITKKVFFEFYKDEISTISEVSSRSFRLRNWGKLAPRNQISGNKIRQNNQDLSQAAASEISHFSTYLIQNDQKNQFLPVQKQLQNQYLLDSLKIPIKGNYQPQLNSGDFDLCKKESIIKFQNLSKQNGILHTPPQSPKSRFNSTQKQQYIKLSQLIQSLKQNSDSLDKNKQEINFLPDLAVNKSLAIMIPRSSNILQKIEVEKICVKTSYENKEIPIERNYSESLMIHLNKPQELNIQMITNKSAQIANVCIQIFNQNPQKGLAYILMSNCIEQINVQSICQFLLQNEGVDKVQLGELLSINEDSFNELCYEYFKCANIFKLDFLDSFRLLLETIKLPSQSSKLNIITEIYSRYFFERTQNGYFKSIEAIQLLIFSLIMLDDNFQNQQKRNKKMITIADFLESIQGLNNGEDYEMQFIVEMYNRIQKQPLNLVYKKSSSTIFKKLLIQGNLILQKNQKIGKEKFYILTDICLYFQDTKDQATPSGFIPLEQCTIRTLNKTTYCFTLVKRGQKLKYCKFLENGSIKMKEASWLTFKCVNKLEWERWTVMLRFLKY